MRQEPTIPEGLETVPTMNGITIRRVWRSWKIVPLALFAGIWDSFLVFWYVKVLATPNPPLMAVIFPIGHIAVGIGITYYVIASAFNKTDVVISPSGVRVVSGPAPWFGNKEVNAAEIVAVLVRERAGNRGRITYSVMHVDAANKERRLLSYLAESDQAHFIAQTIRDGLGLQ